MSQSDEETAIRRRREAWKEAFEASDVDRIMSFYAPGVETVAFDILPPLRFNGRDAYKADWAKFLRLFDGKVAVETKEITIVCSGEVAFIHGLVRLQAAVDGKPLDLWMRATNGLRKINGEWMVVHDHVSVPVDITTRTPAMDLTP